MLRNRGQVCGRRDGDAGLPCVRHNGKAAIRRQPAHAASLGQAPDPADVGLCDSHAASVHQLEKLKASRQPRSGSVVRG
jgi:hypothetical protein